MKIIKDGSASGSVCAEQELQAINAFAKTQLTADEVYAFQVLLCDNEVDRDHERFSVSTLRELSELFVGATGICDHDWRSENQVARIYRTELVTERAKPPRAAKRMSISRALPTCCAPRQMPSLSPR